MSLEGLRGEAEAGPKQSPEIASLRNDGQSVKTMFSRKGLTLTEILIAITLTSLVVLAAASVDITSRRFFHAASRGARVQDEAKIAMEHIVKNVQPGIGDMTNDVTLPGNPPDYNADSRGFFVLDNAGNLILNPNTAGTQIVVKIDYNRDGQFTSFPPDRIIRYRFANNRIFYNPNFGFAGEEPLTDPIVYNATFTTTAAPNHNQVNVEITVRRDPTANPGPENPQATLTSSIILRAMSTN